MSGILYIVGTPIGHLKDITLRALETLKGSDCIFCEDVHVSQKLLRHYQIQTPLNTLQKHNERSATEAILAYLRKKKSVSLISDAGMPLISDPGARLLGAVRAEGFEVQVVPGASALSASVSLLGLEDFSFLGFLPHTQKSRHTRLLKASKSGAPLVLFEAPHRLASLIDDIIDLWGEGVKLALLRELTKMHEEVRIETAGELRKSHTAKGECVLCVFAPECMHDEDFAKRLAKGLYEGMKPSHAALLASESTGVAKSTLYEYLKTQKNTRPRQV